MTQPDRTFLVKIIPPGGSSVYRMALGRRHFVAAAFALALVLLGALAFHTYRIRVAEANVRTLQSVTSAQQAKLQQIDKQADALANELRTMERENAEIKRMIGGSRHGGPHAAAVVGIPDRTPSDLPHVEARLQTLASVSAATSADARQLQLLARRVLNMRRLAALARERMLAAIPSINPVNGGIAASFGWRTNPWPEFHRGVDLEADYGTVVHATATGTVASAGWDGGFGLKVDIDHGNGYHTWYAHLSRPMVARGERVTKGQAIALSGSTGASTGPHLHYQLMLNGEAIDPQPFLHGVPQKVIATLPDSPDV